MRRGIVVLILALVYSTSAFAKHHYHRHHHHHRHGVVTVGNVAEGLGVGLAHVLHDMNRPKDCYGIPWCGCWLKHHLGVISSHLNLNRAIEWLDWGHKTSPHIGAVVVWRHHVGVITGGSPGRWVVTSGNDGHAVRSRRRSVAGAVGFREGKA